MLKSADTAETRRKMKKEKEKREKMRGEEEEEDVLVREKQRKQRRGWRRRRRSNFLSMASGLSLYPPRFVFPHRSSGAEGLIYVGCAWTTMPLFLRIILDLPHLTYVLIPDSVLFLRSASCFSSSIRINGVDDYMLRKIISSNLSKKSFQVNNNNFKN